MARGGIVTDDYTPASSGPIRTRGGLASSRSNASISSLAHPASPSNAGTRSTRALGAVGSKTGPGFSPYARRSAARPPAAANGGGERPLRDEAMEVEAAKEYGQVHGGLVSMVRSLPGKALGFLFRSGSSKTLASSQSSDNLALDSMAMEEEAIEATGASRGRGLPRSSALGRSKGSHHLSNQLSSSTSLPQLYNPSPSTLPIRQVIPGPPRSSHSTLVIPQNAPANLFTRDHSPALSATSVSNYEGRNNRSPSPTRNGLSGSMSTYNLNERDAYLPPSPSTSNIYNQQASTRNYGLTSRSPFAATRSLSTARFGSPSLRSNGSTTGVGHALFPYGSTQTRGQSPGFASNGGSAQKRNYTSILSDAGSPPPRSRIGGSVNGSVSGSTYNYVPALNGGSDRGTRMGSPLNPFMGSGGSNMGDDRVKKKSLVWDAEKGLVSREELERERLRNAPPLPTNEAERILELLEGMGRTPMGDGKRGVSAARPIKQINIPTPAPSFSPRPTSSVLTPSSPYARRPKAGSESAGTPARAGTGLSGVFRAREERRRLAEDAERAEREQRERERMEDEERDRARERKRRERKRDEEFEAQERELERERAKADAPRRSTRSMVKSPPPKSASKGKGKAPASAKAKGKGKAKKEEENPNDAESAMEQDDVPNSRRSKSPAPKTLSPPAAPTTTLLPPPVQQGGSSLRPGKAHSSRAHVASAKVFSAREEDLPPIDESELSKIKLPTMMFPAGFSFGGPPIVTPAASTKEAEQEKVLPGDSLLSRMTAAAPSTSVPALNFATTTTTAPPFSFGASKASVVPAFTLPSTSQAPALSSTLTKSSSSDFFATPLVPASIVALPTAAPNFFGAVLASSTPVAPSPPVPISNAFSFPTAAIKSVETPAPLTFGAPKEIPSNPFAAFGKPPGLAAAEVKIPSNMFGSSPAAGGLFGAPVKAAETLKITVPSSTAAPSFTITSAPTTSLFGQPPASATTPLQSPAFNFAPPPVFSREASPFALSSATTAPSGFGGFGATPAIEDPDEDSGMEDETVSTTVSAAPSNPFGAPAASLNMFSATSTAPAPFTFGAPAKAPTNIFGSASAAPPSNSLFGTAPTSTSSPFGSTVNSPAQTPPVGGVFNFGTPASSAPSPFSMPSASSNPFGAPATPAAAPSPFAFGTPAAPVSQPMFGAAPAAVASPFGGAGGFSFNQQPSTPGGTPFVFGATGGAAPGGMFGAPSTGFASPSLPTSPSSGGAMFNLGSGGEEASPAKGGRRIAGMRRKK